MHKLLKKFRARLRVWLGFQFIHCESPEDILVIRRYGTSEEWEYTMEALAQVVGSCGHPHTVLFADAQFKPKNPQ